MKADIRELVRKLLSSKKAMTAAAALGIMGMLMILFSGGDKNENTVQTQDVPESASWSDYSTQTEERLETILSAIDGVGRVKVMVTVSSTEEYVYAEAEKLGADREERDYVTVKGSGGEEALVRKINVPVITGVVAVCDGGNSDKVREDVYRAVTAAGVKAQILAAFAQLLGQLRGVALLFRQDTVDIQAVLVAQLIGHIVDLLPAVRLARRGIYDENMLHRGCLLAKFRVEISYINLNRMRTL